MSTLKREKINKNEYSVKRERKRKKNNLFRKYMPVFTITHKTGSISWACIDASD